MTRRPAVTVVVALVIAITLAAPASACLWDRDTLLDEQRGMPTVASILAGKWERHSSSFYEQRIAASRKTLDADPKNLAAMDDLAVALEKTGRVDEAIATMKRKLEVDPDGYTTHANLGTFYLHAGDFENGIAHIKRAMEINPDAHFGRERYQLMVAQYIRDGKKNPAVFESGSFVLPLLIGDPNERAVLNDDAKYFEMLKQQRENIYRGRGENPEVSKAIEGVVGMIRFGTGTSPDLFYALGDLLAARQDRHLAYRAYHRALELNHRNPEQVKHAMEQVKEFHEDPSGFRDDVIAAERNAGASWVTQFQAFEDDLVRQGRDPSDTNALAAFYAKHGDPRKPPPSPGVAAATWSRLRHLWYTNPLMLIPIGAAFVLILAIVRRFWRRANQRAAATA